MLDRQSANSGLTRPLRIGVIVGKHGPVHWQMRILDRLEADPRFQLMVKFEHQDRRPASASLSLFRLVNRLERAFVGGKQRFKPHHVNFDLLRTEDLSSKDNNGCYDVVRAERFIEELDLDLIIRMTVPLLPEDAVERLPFGEWSFSFTANQAGLTDWGGFEDIIHGRPSTRISLDIRSAEGSWSIASGAFNCKFSAVRNADFVKERAVTMLMRELGRLHASGILPSARFSPVAPTAPPNAGDLARYSTIFTRNLYQRAMKLFKAKVGLESAVWTLFIGHGDILDFDPVQAVEVPPNKGEIRADPFLFEHEAQLYLFYEAYAPGDRKAHIAVARLDNNILTPLGPALKRSHHLSYPYVFRHDGGIFMLPETNQAGRLEIWRCVEFPHRWELYSTALEGCAPADSVLLQHAGNWWLFTNLSDFHTYEDHCSELYIFRVDGPALKEVVPHKLNPVIIDGTFARNAGRIFSRNDMLYRPSQRNEYGIYGYGLNIMEINELTLDTFSERCIRVVLPEFRPGLMGCHHFDAAAGRYVVDARLS